MRLFLGLAAAFLLSLLVGGCEEIAKVEKWYVTPRGKFIANTDEKMVGTYTLPDLFKMQDGRTVSGAEMWSKERRPEILELYRKYIYGRSPGRPAELTFNVIEEDRAALAGKAIRKQVTVNFFGAADPHRLHMLIYLPVKAREAGPVPVVLALSFSANHEMSKDAGVNIYPVWDRKTKKLTMPGEETRGRSKFWDLQEMLDRGYGVAAICYNEIEPDFADGSGAAYGVRGHYMKAGEKPGAEDWGAISAWAWGASRAMDYLVTDPDVDAKHIVMMGQSRLGKTALWAGAQDERFAAVVACNSGEMGAALSRRNYGETVDSMIKSFPYQFCGNFPQWKGRWGEMPVDANCLVAEIAPRPLYLTTGSLDTWSDPRGEFLAEVNAGPVWRLFGKEDLGTEVMPPLDVPIIRTLAYHCHTGKHETTTFDWRCVFDFLDLNFKGKPVEGIPSTKSIYPPVPPKVVVKRLGKSAW